MIERKFINKNLQEYRIKKYVSDSLSRAGLSDVKVTKTPLGEKIIVHASRPGLVVGRGGANIAQLTKDLKKEFNLENPQIELEEVGIPFLDPSIISEMIVNSMEKFGSNRFKGIGYKALQDVMNAGARGVEILISGKIPSARARTWRFYAGYLKKCGDIAITGVDVSYNVAKLKTGAVGVKVSIMPPTTKLPDDITVYDGLGVEEVDAKEDIVAKAEKTEAKVVKAVEKAVKEAKTEVDAKEKAVKKPKAEKKTTKKAVKTEVAEEKPAEKAEVKE